MPNRILLIFITLLLGIGSASAQKSPRAQPRAQGQPGFAKERYDRSIERYTQRSKRPPKTSRPPTTWGAPSTVPKNTRRRPRCSNASPQTPPAPTRNGRGFLQPRQRPIQTGKIPGSARKLQELPADESCRPGGQVQLRLHQATAAKTAERGSKQKIRTRTSRTGGGQDQNQDKNKDNNSDKDRQQDKGGEQQDQQDRQNGQNDPDKNGQNPDEQPQDSDKPDSDDRQPGQPRETDISLEEQERMLDAIQARRTRPRRNSRRKPGSRYAAIKTGNESILKRLCNSLSILFCGCSRSFRSWWSITSGGPVRAALRSRYRPSTVSPKHRAPYVITCGICLSRCAARPSRSSS